MNIVLVLITILAKTPIYAWVILVLLIKRGIKATKDSVLSLKRMLIFPIVFIVWGLEKVILGFAFPVISILTYMGMALIATAIGYVLYRHFRQFYVSDHLIYRSGTYLPMMIMMLNFLVKYILNVVMDIQPKICANLTFNFLYAVICGFLIGISIGGIVQAALFLRTQNYIKEDKKKDLKCKIWI